MCTGKCAKCIGVSLYPLVFVSIVSNLFLLFPDFKLEFVENSGEQLTPEVLYLGGIIGGGLLVLVPAIHIQATGREGCCNNRCGMFLSILFAAIGVAGSVYCFVISIVAIVRGPTCEYNLGTDSENITWGRPFYDNLKNFTFDNYLSNTTAWDECLSPKDVVVFNLSLFSIAVVASGIELILCTIQMFNGLFGCICGTCRNKD
ncbi:transmembrane 4 L6 family member 4-like [Pelobates fuscus]|uniref:transmembrane 4 L6 family member 4-like n=1 Tax=Pelobates fuscus TaxID=191477 RepID=UPI002FE44E2D